MSSYYKQTQQKPAKNVFKSTTNKPLRFAILGPHKSSKSSFISIIANQMSLANYYPTIQNSPILLQFQPKDITSRAILDIHVTLKDLDEIGVLNNEKIQLNDILLRRIDKEGLSRAKNQLITTNSESIKILTNEHYDLDYSCPDLFEIEEFSPVNSFSSPLNNTIGISPFNSISKNFVNFGMSTLASQLSPVNSNEEFKTGKYSKLNYKVPIATPILVELIDTPGIQKDDLIPFLERSLDCKLSKDVLNNLANEYNTNFRSRVKPLITGSGISDLNAAVDGYLLTYSCIPEYEQTEVAPPTYGSSSTTSNSENEVIEVLESLYISICEAWKEWTNYHMNWEIGKEYDELSISSSLKQMFKKKESTKEVKDYKDLSPEEKKKVFKYLEKTHDAQRPPIVIACTHIDSQLAAPVLIEKGKKLAKEWGCTFVEVSCAYDSDQWVNVDETLSLLVRETIEKEVKKRNM
ncbi:hypothetical protein DAMA08_011760 [Martiniozyma asiatica (nom. inval.)]|nr:hypothetical protein DAMA08_011760 [Martiniozyma asiatica]